jgi:hypothetical protein
MNNLLFLDYDALVEELLRKKRLSKESKLWLLSRMRGNLGNVKQNIGNYEQFLKPDEINIFASTPCPKKLPGGRYCDLIEGHLTEISVIGCIKCKYRITGNTLAECIKEDEYAIE